MTEDDRDDDSLLDDLVSSALGPPEREDPRPSRIDPPHEQVIRLSPTPFILILLAGAAVGGLYIYRNTAVVFGSPDLPAEVAVGPSLPLPAPIPRPADEPAAVRGETLQPKPAVSDRPIPPEPTPPPRPRPRPTPVNTAGKKVDVQVGAFATQTYYNRAVREIKKIGYRPVTVDKNAGVPRYEVRIGPFREREEAEVVYRNLPEHGFPSSGVELRTFRRRDGILVYFITLSDLERQEKIEAIVRKARTLGLPHSLHKEDKGTTVRVVKVDNLTEGQARKLVSRLRDKGYEPKILE